ncbi:MAG: class I SAM-dependent methyltransferase [Aureliella sp.]
MSESDPNSQWKHHGTAGTDGTGMEPTFVPATGTRTSWLLPWYDTLVAIMARESVLKSRMATMVLAKNPAEVLDVGCGTATLMLMLQAQAAGRGQILKSVGVDPDPKILERANQKAGLTRHKVELVQANSVQLPFPDDTYDAVCTSLVMHHLLAVEKQAAIHEMRRVCRPGGILVLSDFCRPQNWLARFLFVIVRCFDGFDRTKSNLQGALPDMIARAGWRDISEAFHLATALGTIRCYIAVNEA